MTEQGNNKEQERDMGKNAIAEALQQATSEAAKEQQHQQEAEAKAKAKAEAKAAEAEANAQEASQKQQEAEKNEAEKEAKASESKSGARWYIVHAYSGFEKKVAASIQEQSEKKGMAKLFEDVVVPTESVVEVKKGKKVSTERKFFPGYVLVKMVLNDDTWHLVKSTPKVTGFIGGDKNRPQPISEAEAKRIFDQIQQGMETPRHKVVFNVGDSVKVIDGPFDSFVGTIDQLDDERQKLMVSVSIFGRPTPLELDYSQVEKV